MTTLSNTPQEIVVTLVHKGAHQTRSFRGFTSVTKAEEYFAFRRELLFNLNRRPTLAERLDLWEKIKHSDEYSSIPMGIPPFKNRSKP